MEYRIKSTVASLNGYNKKINYIIPNLCPNCGVANNPSTYLFGYENFGNNKYIIPFKHVCPSCCKEYYTFQQIMIDNSINPKLLAIYPQKGTTQFDNLITDLSPCFVKIYHQAEQAENNESYLLAGMGYRAAIENLIADYALKILHESKEEIEKLKNLNNYIAHYFKGEEDLMNTSDVVRIYGNEYIHWKKPENFDEKQNLQQEKLYFQIFIDRIKTEIIIKNPPVKRPNSQKK